MQQLLCQYLRTDQCVNRRIKGCCLTKPDALYCEDCWDTFLQAGNVSFAKCARAVSEREDKRQPADQVAGTSARIVDLSQFHAIHHCTLTCYWCLCRRFCLCRFNVGGARQYSLSKKSCCILFGHGVCKSRSRLLALQILYASVLCVNILSSGRSTAYWFGIHR